MDINIFDKRPAPCSKTFGDMKEGECFELGNGTMIPDACIKIHSFYDIGYEANYYNFSKNMVGHFPEDKDVRLLDIRIEVDYKVY